MYEEGEKLPSIETAPPISASLTVTASPPVNPPPGHKTPQVKEKEEFTLKPPPFKAKTKKIQMRKTSLTKIKEGYDYGLHENKELVI